MTLHPQLVNNFSKIIFTPKYVDSRALLSIVASRIYALFVVKSTSVPKLGGGESSQFWQCQDFESACYPNSSLIKVIWIYLYSSGLYSDWTDWSPCSISCAESTALPGVKNRTATCKQDCNDAEETLAEETSCWGNPDPTFCSTGPYYNKDLSS